MGKNALTYKAFGDAALLIEWPNKMSESILKEILSFCQKLQQNNSENIKEVIQSINSVTVIYDQEVFDYEEMKQWAENAFKETLNEKDSATCFLWKIPVCYDEYFGLDLPEISTKNKLSTDAIVQLHSDTIYQVYSIGFLPGFLYLGGLDKRLHIDRKSSPRLEIQKGSVGIGGEQTGIYPTVSPGGWQIIGNTPISFFDITKDIPCFAKPGDKIQFVSISLNEYKAISELVSSNSYSLGKEIIHD